MTFTTATAKPFQDTSREEGLIQQSRETGQTVPIGQNNVPSTVKKEGPVVKPWAHFVAGG